MEQSQRTDDKGIGLLRGRDGLRLLLSLWDNFPEHMFIIRVDGPDEFIVEAINPAHEKTLGKSTDITGQRIDAILPRDAAEPVIQRYRHCVATGEPYRYEECGYFVDEQGMRQEGHWLTLLVPISDMNGRVHHLFGISKNITEVIRARQEVEAQNRILEERVAERTRELEKANAELKHQATRDFLTDCYNRRHLTEIARLEMERARRYDMPFTLALIDIDKFKAINDQHGHNEGDRTLRALATCLRKAMRRPDILGRYGGDEFLVLMPETDITGARVISGRLQDTVRKQCGQTISIGLAQLKPSDGKLESIIERADRDLMSVKESRKKSP
ncbi:sensor domain-containing diguanylate cyclase [Natronospira bacteriovora]|uniref:diguanylate cyclase n=1 Tax=Natronospira bacteriovora TaxID=3069753 RepID=A0ABU0W9J0_9GAMM|nr:sensor domain-containing diguanylate cyclase [Natronospira sp. AB-CW4]MDQ2070696.1 diguanylate cyclase [Natronospira sp. AB-CW4]